MVFKTPPFLKSGDCIGIAATARWVTTEQLQPAIDCFTAWGLRVKVASNVHTPHFQLAGTALQRANGLQSLLDDEEVKAVIIARGGYGTVHTIDLLDFSRFESAPKWIAGYSDITVLHTHTSTAEALLAFIQPCPFRFRMLRSKPLRIFERLFLVSDYFSPFSRME
jgi:muramoyltetrapeptide carboxypeptidase